VESRRWTDERLDDLAESVRNGFERTDRDMRDLRAEIAGLREWMLRMTLGMSVGFISVLAAILARGA
jgi:hypothetical protein